MTHSAARLKEQRITSNAIERNAGLPSPFKGQGWGSEADLFHLNIWIYSDFGFGCGIVRRLLLDSFAK